MLAPQFEHSVSSGFEKTVRVLQLVENLDKQAVETWLVRVLRGITEKQVNIHWTFFCVFPKAGRLDDTVRELGADIIYSPYEWHDKVRFLHGLRKVLNSRRYDILHCHHDIMSAGYLLASAGLPFRKRIVHLHNTSLSLPTPSRMKVALMKEPMRQICLRMADQIVASSNDALTSITGEGKIKATRDLVIHYGVDTSLFAATVNGVEFRKQLGFSANAKLLLFVGRMVDYKNPQFVIDVLERLRKLEPDFHAIFVGTGPLEACIVDLAKARQLQNQVRVLGFRTDVPAIMKSADVLIWPSVESPKEGLGLGIVEAQAAGLPVVMSLSVPLEAVVVPELVQSLALAAGPEKWAEEILKLFRSERPTRADALARVESSSFSMREGVSNMMALYGVQNGNCS